MRTAVTSAGRSRLLREVVAAVREVWPEDRALLVRISATDWVEGGHDLEDSIEVCGWLRDLGVDLIDVSSGGVSPDQRITPAPGYQVPLAARIRAEAAHPDRGRGHDHRARPGRADPGRRVRGPRGDGPGAAG